ncbi:MAG: hypothetical protein P1V97_00900 [Planctomycetota bacterium]|nr:hypothetical protein [Planctomycetota bacterium]
MLNPSRANSMILILTSLFLTLSTAVFANEADYSGDWQSSFGKMHLTQSKAVVTGYYIWDGEKGVISGKVVGAKLIFKYKALEENGEGVFTLSKDKQSFQGKWRVAGTKEWGEWTGKRIVQKIANYSGVWKTRYGRLRLIQKGQAVRGISAYTQESKIRGDIKSGTLHFQYREEKGKPGGKGEFQLAKDGQSFSGRWKSQDSTEWADWNGQRVNPEAGRRWLIVLEANWESSLAEKEYSFGKMLKAFFARQAKVGVRHRSFSNKKSLQKWCRDIAFLPEPVVLVIASHGTPQGLVAGDDTVTAKDLGPHLTYAHNIELLHFAACSVMRGKVANNLQSELEGLNSFPISGYTRDVDWGASAVLEFMYYELILTHGIPPKKAAAKLLKILPFAGKDKVSGAPFESADFRFLDNKD